jgi:hypothetical protein
MNDETYYLATAPDWQPGGGLVLGPEDRIQLCRDLEEAVELAGDIGGYVVEVTLEPGSVTKDPAELRHPFVTAPIPPRRVRVLGT